MPALNPLWLIPPLGFTVAAVIYIFGRKWYARTLPSLELGSEDFSAQPFGTSCQNIVVRNNSDEGMTNVVVEVIGVRQHPERLHDLPSRFRLTYSDGDTNIINPKSRSSFAFVRIVTKGGNREFSLASPATVGFSFSDDLPAIMRAQTYTFEVSVSCREFSAMTYLVELKWVANATFDGSVSLPFPFGFDISIEDTRLRKGTAISIRKKKEVN